ncbi:hypothetical protein G5C51_04420 [Streptomyces sp. A7024]|uniref:Uncharacterized protein n=1 Tax=Streptomyces coryli TaxID=1128680 RepID=A0A6G4TTP8_9ACTN|nr:hypothetical protein [Streptomyces coryli]NGN63152.1 hypothetical protein [Streptomyces coryli]
MTTVCALVRDVSMETLRDAGLRDQAAAHRAARCAEMWAVEKRRRLDRAALDRHAEPGANR